METLIALLACSGLLTVYNLLQAHRAFEGRSPEQQQRMEYLENCPLEELTQEVSNSELSHLSINPAN